MRESTALLLCQKGVRQRNLPLVSRIVAVVGTKQLSKLAGPYLQSVLGQVYRNLALGENNEIRLVSEEAAYEALINFFADWD